MIEEAKEELKDAVEAIKKKQRDLEVREQVVNLMMPGYYNVLKENKEEMQKETLNKIETTAKETSETIKQSVEKMAEVIVEAIPQNDFTEVVSSINRQIKESGNESSKVILNELRNITSTIAKLGADKGLSQQFIDSVGKITNAINLRGEEPISVEYKRVNGRIMSVVETFERYTLTHAWAYDQDKQLRKVTTTRNETT